MDKTVARVISAQPHHLSGIPIIVELDAVKGGQPTFSIVGLPDKAVEESRDRVLSALRNSGFGSPKSQGYSLVASLSPSEIKKEGAFHDLAIALAFLIATKTINTDTSNTMVIGELSLSGDIKGVRGIVPLIQSAKKNGYKTVIIPSENKAEASIISGISILSASNLAQVVNHWSRHSDIQLEPVRTRGLPSSQSNSSQHPDWQDIKGQDSTKRALLIAVAGGHNIGMIGPPGTGKTMLARATAGILPSLAEDEALEVLGIHSIAGHKPELSHNPPIRSPHHTASHIAILGGGQTIKPGEVTLAHRGLLFLDELLEFDRRVLEGLRQPLEDRVVTIARARDRAVFPASFMLVVAMNPCPCGYMGSDVKDCTCSAYEIARYQKKLSGPIIDRIDLWSTVEHIEYEQLSNKSAQGPTTDSIKKAVQKAREFKNQARPDQEGLNAELKAKNLQMLTLQDDVVTVLNTTAKKLSLSPRAYHRTIKVARTIADLAESQRIETQHILEALQYRSRI